MHYEVVGEGEPVVLVHGTGGSADSWIGQWDVLLDWYRLYMPDFTDENFAEDLAGFIEALDVGPVRLVGWSDGASVAVRLAVRRPDLVSRVALIGGAASNDPAAVLSMPLLVMQGDDDCVEVARSAALACTAPDGRLAVVPGTSRVLPLEKPELVNLILLDFFEDESVADS